MGEVTDIKSRTQVDIFEKRDDVDEEVLLDVLGEAVKAIEDEGIPYVFIGGLASVLLGPPSSTNDIDFFVRPEDAERVMETLSKRGFETKVHDPSWLMKGVKKGVLVDVIFKSTGDIFLDDEMLARASVGEFKRQRLRIVSPEDLMVMKALAHQRDTHYWYDALDLLAHSEMDWDYVLRRARHGPRRILSLLAYAQSEDLAVPNTAIQKLVELIYGG
ncbi:MAG TPA: nucleotidyltransferase [Actinomycetota bacterium]|nr:nucleotidyltransferase [Actinomycetota bacterium]